MAECKVCGKALNKEASNIGSWCIDCIKEMSNKNTSFMESFRNSYKKERLLLLIFAAIGLIIGAGTGISSDDVAGIFFGIWCGIGGGTGLGFFINEFAFGFKWRRNRGDSFEDALKGVFLEGLIYFLLGFFGGVIYFLFLVLRRNSWIKKFDTIIASEDGAIAELEDYTWGKDINMSDLSRKVSVIADNFKLIKDNNTDKQYRSGVKVVQ